MVSLYGTRGISRSISDPNFRCIFSIVMSRCVSPRPPIITSFVSGFRVIEMDGSSSTMRARELVILSTSAFDFGYTAR